MSDYSEAEWHAAIGHHPLADRPLSDLLLLHRHWMWANQQREAFDSEIAASRAEPLERGPAALASRRLSFMFVWYGMLWSVIEALTESDEGRSVNIRGRFLEDIQGLAHVLRRCRNAILHVPRSGELLDARIIELVAAPESANTIRRISSGLGRLFLDEFRRRGLEDNGTG